MKLNWILGAIAKQVSYGIAMTLAATPAWAQTAIAPVASPETIAQLMTTMDCGGCLLTGARLRYRDLAGANLAGANLAGADLTFVDLSGADLSGANLVGANLHRANLQGANLSGANLSRAAMMQAQLQRANLQNTRLAEANLQGADVTDVDAAGVNLCYTTLPSGAQTTRGCPLVQP